MTSQHRHDRERRATGRVVSISIAVAALVLTSAACSEGEPSRNAAGPATAAPSSPAPTGGSSAPAPPSTPKPGKPKPQAPGGAGEKPDGGAPAAPSDPAAAQARKYAQAYAEAINAQDTKKMVSLVCDLTKVEKVTYIRYFNKQFEGGKAKVTLVGPTKTKGNLAQTRAKSVATKNGERGAKALTITMQQKGEKWCIPSRG